MAETLTELLERCHAGDEPAVRVLAERFGPAARDLAATILHDGHLAEGAVQAAFVSALRRLGQLRQGQAFSAWLRQIVRTEAQRILRKRREPTGRFDEVPAAGQGPPECAEQRERREMVRRALGRVSATGRETAELFYFEDLSLLEVAARLRVPEGTVKRRLHDVRAQLRDLLLGYFEDADHEADPADRPGEWPLA